MSEISSCHTCGGNMSDADHKAESPMGDALCISCRKHLEQCREEEATASFCEGLRNPVAEWFTDIITKSGFKFYGRTPEDINERCSVLRYQGGKDMFLFFERISNSATLMKREWQIRFSLITPVPIILAAIKSALEQESK